MNKVGRNDPCPCGSGLKFKKCHGGGVAFLEPAAQGAQLSESAKKSGWLNYPTRSYQRMLEHAQLPNDLEFWAACAKKFGVPVLCLCCGTGREAFYLAERGFAITGVDLNEGFIRAAEEQKLQLQAVNKTLDLDFVRDDVITMKLGKKFPLAMMATQSFQLLLTSKDISAFLATLRDHLSDGGVFVFNVTIAVLEGTKFVDGFGERIGTYSNDLDRMPRILNHGPLNQRVSTREEIEVLLQGAGFKVACVRGKTEHLGADFMEKATVVDLRDNEYTIVAIKI
jgi:SAM-dependent methyltransferase